MIAATTFAGKRVALFGLGGSGLATAHALRAGGADVAVWDDNISAREKAAAVPADADEVVLCADTTVALGRRILGKPENAGEAAEFLLKLSGRRHRVITAVAVKRGERVWERVVETVVKVKALSDTELNAYLQSGEWQGKAGAYGIQGRFGALIPWIQGSFTGVVGLPVAETATLLQAAGITIFGECA